MLKRDTCTWWTVDIDSCSKDDEQMTSTSDYESQISDEGLWQFVIVDCSRDNTQEEELVVLTANN